MKSFLDPPQPLPIPQKTAKQGGAFVMKADLNQLSNSLLPYGPALFRGHREGAGGWVKKAQVETLRQYAFFEIFLVNRLAEPIIT